jgi:signal transduction histidine kinase
MSSLRRALLGLGAVGVIFGLALIPAIVTSDQPNPPKPLFAVIAPLIGWSFIGTGLFAWWRRPQNRFGALLVAVGFSWFLGALSASNVPALGVSGFIVGNVYIVLLVYALLAFPSGRLEGTAAERVVLALGWIAALGLQLLGVFFFKTPDPDYCDGCPVNPLLIHDSKSVLDVVYAFQSVLGIAALVGLVVILVRRWRAASPTLRGSLSTVLWVGAVGMGILVASLAVSFAGAPEAVQGGFYIAGLLAVACIPFGFLAGLLRTRFSRAEAVNELVERLGSTPAGAAGLRDALATALGDPSLTLAYWLPARTLYVDAAGRAIDLPAAESGRAASIVEREGEPVAAIIHDESLREERALIRTIGAAAALRLENERLDAELRAKLEELRDSRARIVQAGDSERRRLERDLHDGAQQRLVALSITLRLARGQIASDPERAGALLDETAEELARATKELRELAQGIHPAVLTDRGLGAALDALAGRAPLPVELVSLPQERLPTPIESAAYFVVAEALTNVAKYAQATIAQVEVARDNGRVTVEVRDNGIGGADPAGGSGLRGLSDRVAALDGRLLVASPPGGGTVLRAEIPCG